MTYSPCNSATNINQRRELRLWAAQNNPALLPDAALFANIDEFRSDSTSNYHGLLLSGRGSLGGVNLDANYTISRCMTDRVAPGIPNPNETFHRERDRSHCQSDRRHVFNLAVVAAAPQLQGRAWNAIASNWRFSALYRASSAAPLTIASGVDRALSGLGGQTADRLLDDVYQDRSGGLNTQYFNRAAFALPALGSYGNMDFLSVRGFNTWSLDIAISRIFSLGTHRIEARWEVFNPFNAAIPNDPVTALSSPVFGRVTTMRDPRIMQFAAKYVF